MGQQQQQQLGHGRGSPNDTSIFSTSPRHGTSHQSPVGSPIDAPLFPLAAAMRGSPSLTIPTGPLLATASAAEATFGAVDDAPGADARAALRSSGSHNLPSELSATSMALAGAMGGGLGTGSPRTSMSYRDHELPFQMDDDDDGALQETSDETARRRPR